MPCAVRASRAAHGATPGAPLHRGARSTMRQAFGPDEGP
jgi:hypothetical protein